VGVVSGMWLVFECDACRGDGCGIGFLFGELVVLTCIVVGWCGDSGIWCGVGGWLVELECIGFELMLVEMWVCVSRVVYGGWFYWGWWLG